jgi:hypothetical protein
MDINAELIQMFLEAKSHKDDYRAQRIKNLLRYTRKKYCLYDEAEAEDIAMAIDSI